MAEDANNGSRMKSAAESALLQLAARWGIVAICTVAMPLGAWMGARLVETLDRVAEKVGGVEMTVQRLTVDMDYVKRDISELKER